jgi:hypothetical protein
MREFTLLKGILEVGWQQGVHRTPAKQRAAKQVLARPDVREARDGIDR